VSTDGFTYSPIRSIFRDRCMLRRDLLRSLLAMPVPGWLRHMLRRPFSGADSQEADAAAIYRSAFGWTKGLRPEESDRLRNAATIAVDGPHIDALIRHGGSALKSLRTAAMRQCDWGVEPISADDLGKGHRPLKTPESRRSRSWSAIHRERRLLPLAWQRSRGGRSRTSSCPAS
jgi:hypothetical protein